MPLRTVLQSRIYLGYPNSLGDFLNRHFILLSSFADDGFKTQFLFIPRPKGYYRLNIYPPAPLKAGYAAHSIHRYEYRLLTAKQVSPCAVPACIKIDVRGRHSHRPPRKRGQFFMPLKVAPEP